MIWKKRLRHTVILYLLRAVTLVLVAAGYVSLPADTKAPAVTKTPAETTTPIAVSTTDEQVTNERVLSTAPYPELYRGRLVGRMREVGSDGAIGINSKWEHGQFHTWYIEQQRYASDLVIGGLLLQNTDAIDVGLRAFTWGFAHQARDGSFPGTGEAFHSTSFFVEAVAHSLLLLQASQYEARYHDTIQTMIRHVHKAASWMSQPRIWRSGVAGNHMYTHRRYLVAAALGLTGVLTNDAALVAASRNMIKEGLSLQTPQGYNPEKRGYDSSYHMVGITYAETWLAFFSSDPLAPSVSAMIEKGLSWEATRISPNGKVNVTGNTRTAGQETGRDGITRKKPAYTLIAAGFMYWGIMNKNQLWIELGLKVHSSQS